MNTKLKTWCWCLSLLLPLYAQSKTSNKLFKADHPYFQYTGRIDFTNPQAPKFWNPGVYIKAKFKGSSCTVLLNDEVLYGNSYNYIELVVDGTKHFRVKTTGTNTSIDVVKGLSDGNHDLVICKDTEAGMGYIKFVGLICQKLLPPDPKPSRKIEFYGNSITCGAESDLSEVPYGKGTWYDRHNAYMSYGAETARRLNAQWQLTSVSGIGLIHSCCNMDRTMPDVYNKLNLQKDGPTWDFSRYVPDLVSICLGQNDGIQDSTQFCSAYVKLIENLQSVYPTSHFILITSPMANDTLRPVLKSYITGVLSHFEKKGDKKIHSYFFTRSWNSGGGAHPRMDEHQLIADELTRAIKSLMGW